MIGLGFCFVVWHGGVGGGVGFSHYTNFFKKLKHSTTNDWCKKYIATKTWACIALYNHLRICYGSLKYLY